jgi:hypothetical protein
MKTTIDIPESLYTTLAAASSAQGLTLEDYILRAAKEKTFGAKIASPTVDVAAKKHQLAEFFAYLDSQSEEEKKATREAVAEVQAIIDEEFSRIDPRDWE